MHLVLCGQKQALSLLAILVLATASAAQERTADLYQLQIKPVLRERCFACHGALKQESDLRLDTVRAMREADVLDSGELLERVSSTDESYRMPPEGEPLSKQEVKSIQDWLNAGAIAPSNEEPELDPTKHWAFQRIERPQLPNNGYENPVDAFLMQKIDARGLAVQPEAPRKLLIRRLYLDLIGIPPTTEQLESTVAIEQQIDNLLAMSQYGERWGRHWMDVWRYSDWYGLGDMLRNSQKHIWRWRDWIVNSLNDDKGYDQMILEMLAADELAPNDLEAVAATGFLARNYYLFNRTTWIDNTIEHTNKAFLGLTMNCAKCHDHKYDPISQEDYYRMRAIFEPHHVRLDALPGETDFEKDGLPRVYDDDPDAITYLHLRGDPSRPEVDNPLTAGVPDFLASFAEDPQLVELPVESWAPGTRDYIRRDRLELARSRVDQAEKELENAEKRQAVAQNIATRSPEAYFFDDDFRRPIADVWRVVGDSWRYENGVLKQTQPTTERKCLQSKWIHPEDFELSLRFKTTGGVKWKSTGIRFDADQAGSNAHTVYVSAVAGASRVQLSHQLDGNTTYPGKAKVDCPIEVNQEYELQIRVCGKLINVSLDGAFLFAYELPNRSSGSLELFTFDSTADFYQLRVERLNEAVPLREVGSPMESQDAELQLLLAHAGLKLAETQLKALEAQIVADDMTLKVTKNDRTRFAGEAAKLQAAKLQAEARLAQVELDVLKAKESKKDAAVKRRDQLLADFEAGKFPDYEPLRGSQRALNQKTHQASQYPPTYAKISTGRRAAFAKWIVHRDNPLTARVAVNHIWMRHFGTPLVESVFDFGRRAPRPKHRDLLDYLAVELIESGWSMKHLHRLILNSEAWQRTSSNLGADETTLEADPENLFYWRMNSPRMESQVLRDSLLHLAGQLDLTMGGPSIPSARGVQRRSLYLVHALQQRDKFLNTFDDAEVLQCYRRSNSIVPQQALAMMNSYDVHTASKGIANRMDDGQSDLEFANAVFGLLLARDPSEEELDACVIFLRENPDRGQFVLALLNHNDFLVVR